MKYIIVNLVIFVCVFPAGAQSNIDAVLASIATNNKTIDTNSKYWDAKKLEYKTGISMYDPTVSYDYMRGTPNAISGNQTDINIVQKFDYPTVYAKKKILASEQGKQAEFYLLDTKQSILLSAKKICIELIYRRKMQSQINTRVSTTEKYLNDFQKKLLRGEGNILDVNKAKLQLIEINKDYQFNQSAINQLSQQLTALNGGKDVLFSDMEYPDVKPLLSFEMLEAEIEKIDPTLKYLEQQKTISQKEVEVTKAMALPKFDVGYHFQAVLGQRFNGGKVGMSIPVWENKNRVKAKQAELFLAGTKIDEHKNEHFFEIKQYYEKYVNLRKTLDDYSSVLASINTVPILDKALALGEITTLAYFLEVNYLYQATDNYLLLEKDYHDTIADLEKYKF